MKRRFWLTLTVTILFGIEAPLCSMACLDSFDTFDASSEISAMPASHAPASMPCHESESGDAPSDSGNAHDDCGCDFSVAGLLSDTPTPELNPNHELGLFRTRPLSRMPTRHREYAIAAFENVLPPPDLLLQKSTLLI